MKKILLLAALAAGALGAQAEGFDDLFKVQVIHGMGNDAIVEEKVYPNGSTIDVQLYEDYGGFYTSECNLRVTNISDEPWQLAYGYTKVEPSASDWNDIINGSFTICHSFYNMAGAPACLPLESGEMHFESSDIDPESGLEIQLHQLIFTSLDPVDIRISLQVYEGEEPLEGYGYDVNLNFTHKYDAAAVGSVTTDSAAAEYFNLQGVRVANPEHGLFIKKQGGKASKVIL